MEGSEERERAERLAFVNVSRVRRDDLKDFRVDVEIDVDVDVGADVDVDVDVVSGEPVRRFFEEGSALEFRRGSG